LALPDDSFMTQLKHVETQVSPVHEYPMECPMECPMDRHGEYLSQRVNIWYEFAQYVDENAAIFA
jgi:hypothetical protein